MPDLMTHALSTRVFMRPFIGGWRMACVLLGCILPDVIGRAPKFVLPIAPEILDPGHSIFVSFAYCALIAILFEKGQRLGTFYFLMLGVVLHLIYDLIQQDYHSSYLLLFPFSRESVHVDLISPHHTVYFIPFWLLLFICGEWFFSKKKSTP